MYAKALLAGVTATAALVLGAAAAAAGTMSPHLGARLSGMGEHGVVNLTSQAAKGRLCWTFDLATKGVTQASIRDAHGMKVAELGMHFSAKGCDAVAKRALQLIEAKPGAYRIWIDTKGHPGDLRGTLFAGMAHM